jgi:hypothetical protein
MTWKELKDLLASGRHHYDPDLLEASPLGLKKYAAIARDYRAKNGLFRGRQRTHDTVTGTAIQFRMGAGFPGAVNRSHPVSIEPCLIDASAPPTLYGQAVLIDPTTQGVRPFVAGDQALIDAYGITVRPYPLQQNTVTPALNTAVPPIAGVIDVLKNGYIMIGFNKSGSAPVKNGQAYIWTAATSGAHIQGGWETAAPAGNGCLIGSPNRSYYQGGWDANDIGELVFHV